MSSVDAAAAVVVVFSRASSLVVLSCVCLESVVGRCGAPHKTGVDGDDGDDGDDNDTTNYSLHYSGIFGACRVVAR